MEKNLLHNPHVGEILKSEFIDELGISQRILAAAIQIPDNTIDRIVKGELIISEDIDARLCKFFKLSKGYFLRLQTRYITMEVNMENLFHPYFYDINKVLEMGAKKYGAFNWLQPNGKKADFKSMHDSMFHHLADSYANIREDHESGLDPLLHLATRALMMYTLLKIKRESENSSCIQDDTVVS